MKRILSFILLALMIATLAACGNNNDTPEDELDCTLTPDDPACIDDQTDTRTAEEILADTFIENFDGDIAHLEDLMDAMDFSNSLEFEAVFDFEVVEDGETHFIHAVMIDKYVFVEGGDLVHRNIAINVDGDIVNFEMIFEEVSTGVVVYLDFSNVMTMLENEQPEVAEVFELLGVNEDWLQFNFDDSLTNLIEIELMREMFADIFFDQMGLLYFYDLSDEIELESGLVLADYELYLGDMMNNLAIGEYDLFEAQLQAIDFDELVLDLDLAIIVPEIVILLTENQVDLEDQGFDVVSSITYLELNGTELWLSTLSDADSIIFFDLITQENEDELPIFCEDQNIEGCIWMDDYYHYYYEDDDPLGEYIINNVNMGEIIALIRDLQENLVLVDFDALMLEEIDVMALKDAFYQGQTEYDAFIVQLELTSPESAKILSSYSPIAGFFEEFVFIPDVRYAIDNLSMFEDYLTLDYYLDNGLIVSSMDKTEDFEIETTLTIAPGGYADIFENIVADIAIFTSGFNDAEFEYVEYINCPDDLPIGEVCQSFDEYLRIVERLNSLDSIEVIALFNPSDPTSISFDFDFTDLANSINDMEQYDDELLRNTVNNLYVPWVALDNLYLPTADLNNNATIVWESNNTSLITNDGVVYRPLDGMEQYVDLVATVTVGLEVEEVYFQVLVPPVGTYEDWYDDYYYEDNNGLDAFDNINDLSLEVTISESASINVPTTTTSVNDMAEKFAKFSLTLMAYDYLDRIYWHYYNLQEQFDLDVGQTFTLAHYVDSFFVTHAFDDELSTVTIGGTFLNPEYEIELYWLDGTKVFINPLTYSELYLVIGPGTGAPSLTSYNLYVENVDLLNFNMTKLLFVYIFNDTYEDEYYQEN